MDSVMSPRRVIKTGGREREEKGSDVTNMEGGRASAAPLCPDEANILHLSDRGNEIRLDSLACSSSAVYLCRDECHVMMFCFRVVETDGETAQYLHADQGSRESFSNYPSRALSSLPAMLSILVLHLPF